VKVNLSKLEKVEWVLNAFSNGEIQAHTSVIMPVKLGSKPDSPIIERARKIPATRIPASTIQKFRTHEYMPRERSIKKLVKFYDQYNYHYLRSIGCNTGDAKINAKQPPKILTPLKYDYIRYAAQIKHNHRIRHRTVPIEAIRWGMAHSKHVYHSTRGDHENEWAIISKFSGLQKHKHRRKSRSYGHHRE
jgi:hypothetical protein